MWNPLVRFLRSYFNMDQVEAEFGPMKDIRSDSDYRVIGALLEEKESILNMPPEMLVEIMYRELNSIYYVFKNPFVNRWSNLLDRQIIEEAIHTLSGFCETTVRRLLFRKGVHYRINRDATNVTLTFPSEFQMDPVALPLHQEGGAFATPARLDGNEGVLQRSINARTVCFTMCHKCANADLEDYNHRWNDPRSQSKRVGHPIYQDVIINVNKLKDFVTEHLHAHVSKINTLNRMVDLLPAQDHPTIGWGRDLRQPTVNEEDYAQDPIDINRCGVLWALKHGIFDINVQDDETLEEFRQRFDVMLNNNINWGVYNMEVRGW